MTPLSSEIDVVVAIDNPPPIDPARLVRLLAFVLAAAGAVGSWSVTVVVTSDEHLRQLHRDFMGIDEETDVMTFPYGDETDGAEAGGDVVISIDRAGEQAETFGHGVGEEIEFLAVHGILHLCGWEDETPDSRTRMLERQSELISAFDAVRD
jgi:probable rRNA maturation factor